MSLKVKDILEILDKYCDFPKVNAEKNDNGYLKDRYSILFEDTYEQMITEPLTEAKELPNGWNYHYGVSKLVLMIPNCSFVVKIPFQSDGDGWYTDRTRQAVKFSHLNKTHFNKSDLTFIKERFYELDMFYGPGNKNNEIEREWDYCELELLYTKKAKEQGFDKYIANTILAGYVQDYPIYIQPKCTLYEEECIENHSSTWTEEKQSKASESIYANDIDHRLSPCWVADFIEMYGEQEFNNFCNFLKENDIGDLHEGNIGYLKGRPVIYDYSGFCN